MITKASPTTHRSHKKNTHTHTKTRNGKSEFLRLAFTPRSQPKVILATCPAYLAGGPCVIVGATAASVKSVVSAFRRPTHAHAFNCTPLRIGQTYVRPVPNVLKIAVRCSLLPRARVGREIKHRSRANGHYYYCRAFFLARICGNIIAWVILLYIHKPMRESLMFSYVP